MVWKQHKHKVFSWHGGNGFSHKACFNCRVSFKGSSTVCPNCSGDLVWLGNSFKPPRKEAKKQWLKVQALVEKQGYYFNTCHSCHFRSDWVKYLNQVKPKPNRKRRHS